MKTVRALPLILCAPLLLLTYFLVQGAAPDSARHEQTLAALRGLVLHNAALQRDVLRARAGLLRSYDPLVQSVAALRQSAAALGPSIAIASGAARGELQRRVDAIGIAIAAQEDVLEQFKSQNALLGNSLSYFNHLIVEPDSGGGADGTDGALAALGATMLRFTGDPAPELAYATVSALNRLEETVRDAGPDGPARHLAPLVAHGRLIVATLPSVNRIIARLQADPIVAQVQAAQDAYLAAYGRAAAHAGMFRVLIYAAAMLLAVYAGHLVLRLRRNARTLRQRLEFEKLIAAVSNEFINLPRERIDEGISNGLGRLAAHAGVDCAWLLTTVEGGSGVRRMAWHRKGFEPPLAGTADLLQVAEEGAKRASTGGILHVPRLRDHYESKRKALLERMGIRSWLSIPMGDAGRPIGFLVLATTGAEKRWAAEDIALVRTASEIFASSILRERGEAERERLGARLREAQRLEAIGTLAGGIAHEFNNVLGLVLGYGEMALQSLQGAGRVRRHLGQIMTAGARGQAIVDQILTFSRRRSYRYRPIAAQAAIAEAIDLLRATLPATLTLETRFDAAGAAVMSDPTELQQVVLNLCRNAVQAMEGRGTLKVATDMVDRAAEQITSHGRLPAGRYMRLAVGDTGPGIAPWDMGRIFEPFFTTKRAGKGTGLGLATVHGIVTQHGGALNVESRLNAGALFEAYFPLTGEAPVQAAPAAEPAVQRGAGETILLVDDEKPLVLLGEEMLAAIGYEPVGFDESASALEAVRADPERFDLVLTDEVMPQMTGTELASALHQIRPDLPVVLMTGRAGDVRPERLQTAGIAEVIRKPLLSAPISACLARHLAQR